MPDEIPAAPDWKNSDQWNEFEWERALRYSDQLAARYFRLLEPFGDLPDAEEFIADRIGDRSFQEIEELEPYNLEAPEDWDDDDDDDDEDEEEAEARERENRGKPGDSLYYETTPLFERARHLALGWCNIYASVLRPEDRQWGLKILFYFGRILSYLALSIGDGTYDRRPASIAFGKRAAQQINVVLGELDTKGREARRYAAALKKIRELLLGLHDLHMSYLSDLRHKAQDDDVPF